MLCYAVGSSSSGAAGSAGSDKASGAGKEEKKEAEAEQQLFVLPRLSEQLQLEDLWETLGECLTELAKTPDHHAVLVLQPAVEAFFIVHAGEQLGLVALPMLRLLSFKVW